MLAIIPQTTSQAAKIPIDYVAGRFRVRVATRNSWPQRLNSLRKKRGGCDPDPAGAGEGSAFGANVKEKADPSGKRRLRDDNLSVFPRAVQPLKYGFCGRVTN